MEVLVSLSVKAIRNSAGNFFRSRLRASVFISMMNLSVSSLSDFQNRWLTSSEMWDLPIFEELSFVKSLF